MSVMIPHPFQVPEEFHSRLEREQLMKPINKHLIDLVNRLVARTSEGRFARDAVRAWFWDKSQSASAGDPAGLIGDRGGADSETDGQITGPRELTVRKSLLRWLEMVEAGRVEQSEAYRMVWGLIAALDVPLIAELCDTSRTPLLINKEGSACEALQVYVDRLMDEVHASGKTKASKPPEVIESDAPCMFSEDAPRKRTVSKAAKAEREAEAIVSRMFTRNKPFPRL